jgi:hypothetical protein
MASKPKQPDNVPADDALMGFLILPLLILLAFAIFWIANKYAIYYNSGKFTYWMLWPFDWIGSVHDYRMSIIDDMRQLPDAGRVLGWLSAAFRAPAGVLGVIALVSGYKAFRHPITKMKGPLSVDALMRYQAQINSALAPIVPIAMEIHKNKDERFHESYHPHEVVQKFRLLNDDNRTLNTEAAEKYFIAQLGSRIYRPGLDDTDMVFADRLNDFEKALFALLAPPALHGKTGRKEYQALKDKLNYSAANARQMPDLRLANDLYQKYRADPLLNNLFRRHHFSVTYLMQLYLLAKKSGKVTTADFVGWLRPNAHGLFVALNTAGRHTPFTESGGAFAHWEFEQACAKKNLMPILPCVAGAVIDLNEQWEFWVNADQRETEESVWGRMHKDHLAQAAEKELFRRFVSERLLPRETTVPAGADNLFDQQMSAERRAWEEEQLAKAMERARQAEQQAGAATSTSA